ncbi:hypothetical protein F5883DRAFT_592078 [Diaporthe sp. PMI_573]|nr:hypothetical protein F5883DRAFT_592078 [Diaporthaceae sp. PMI_573]
MDLPDLLRIVLLVLSFASFLPQLQLLWLRRDSTGISLFYVLFNLIVITEQFTIDLALITSVDGGDIVVHTPATTGDWLNLAQFGTVWVLWVLFFIACMVLSPRVRPRTALGCACAVYMCYLGISLVPIIVVTASGGSDNDRKWFDALFVGFHIIFVNPFITILRVISIYPQARAILGRPREECALSLVGLAAQAVVFLLLGLTWSARFEGWHYPIFGRGFYSWFQMVGYVPFDHIVFAVVQAILLYIALRHNGWPVRVDEAHPPSETDPLL